MGHGDVNHISTTRGIWLTDQLVSTTNHISLSFLCPHKALLFSLPSLPVSQENIYLSISESVDTHYCQSDSKCAHICRFIVPRHPINAEAPCFFMYLYCFSIVKLDKHTYAVCWVVSWQAHSHKKQMWWCIVCVCVLLLMNYFDLS